MEVVQCWSIFGNGSQQSQMASGDAKEGGESIIKIDSNSHSVFDREVKVSDILGLEIKSTPTPNKLQYLFSYIFSGFETSE